MKRLINKTEYGSISDSIYPLKKEDVNSLYFLNWRFSLDENEFNDINKKNNIVMK